MRSVSYGTLMVGTLLAFSGSASAAMLSVQGNTVSGPSNCIPFGGGLAGPYSGFVYQNIPAFQLNVGDKIAFDLGAVGQSTIILDIAMAHAVTPGSDQEDAAGFTTVVSAASPTGNGDTIKGNYDLIFTATTAYTFAGGGLILRFHPQGAYASSSRCDQVMYWSPGNDSTGLFVKRFYSDPDGISPWAGGDTASVAQFRIYPGVVAANNGPYAGTTTVPIALNGTGSSSTAGSITLYEWDCTNDGTFDTSSASPTGSTCTYASAGSFTLALRVTDSAAGTGTSTTTVTVTAPLAITPTSASLAPRATQTFTASGGSGTGYTFSLSTSASGGTINPTTGAYVAGPTGSVTDVVTLTDSSSNSITANVTVGPAITLSPASPASPPRGSISFSAMGGSGTSFTYALAPGGSGGTINPSTGVYMAGNTGSVTDMVTVTDSLGNTKSVNVSVGAGVAISPAAPTSPPRGHLTFTAMGGTSSFTYALTTGGSGGSVTSGGVYTAGTTGGTSDVVTVTDTLGNTASATITVGPRVTLTPGMTALAPGASVALAIAGGSGTGYTYALTTNGSTGSVDSAGHYTAGRTGSTTDVVTATDSLGNTAITTVTVGPAISVLPSSPTSPPRGALDFAATGGSDTGFVWTMAAAASGGSVNASAHYIAGATGSVTDDVLVTDSLGNTAHVHVAVSAGVTIAPAVPMTPPRGALSFSASGGSGTGFTFTLGTNHSGATIAAGGSYTAGATGHTSDTINVTDSLGNTASVSVSVGDGITLNPSSPTTPPMGGVAFTAMGGSGTGFTYAVTSNGSHGSVDSTGHYTAGATGSTSDTVTVTDSLGNTATASVSIGPGLSITPANPTLAPRGMLALSVSGGSGSGYTWSLPTNGSDGAVDASTGAYVAGATGSTTDVAQVTDSLGNTATASITVGPTVALAVTAMTVAPRGTDTFTASAGSGGYVYSIATDASGGATINSMTGAYVAGPHGNVTDLVRAVDSNGNSVTRSVSVGAVVSITPATPSGPPRGAIAFTATGGSGIGYAWTVTTNASGGTIDSSGHYTAGGIGGTADVITATDSLGNTATVSISVGGGLAINPTAPAVSPRGQATLTVTGGSGDGYTWTLTTNASGGAIDSATGVYTAGIQGGVTDVASVADTLGNVATVSITVGPQVTVQPPNASVPVGAQVLFAVMGGSGAGYAWTLPTNATGATINASTGAYTAGTAAGTDVVRVTDSLGNFAEAHVTVTAVTSHPDGGATDAGATDAHPRDAAADSTSAHGSGGGGCSCDVGGSLPSGGALALTGAFVTLLLRRRTRRHRSRG